jgi:hypothetical protein
VFAEDGRSFALRNASPLETKEPLIASARSKAEHVMAEMREAIERPETNAAEREELKEKYAHLEKELAAGEGAEAAQGTMRLAQIRTERVSEGWAAEILSKTGLAIGDTISEEQLKRIRAAAASVDEHVRVEFGRDDRGGVVLTFITR